MENQPIYTTHGETEELIMDIFTDVLNRHGVTLSAIEYAKLECDVMDALCGKYVKMDVTTDDLLGRTVKFGNHKWIVAHIEGEYAYIMLSEVLNQTVFGTDVKYENSELIKAAAAFTSSLPADALDQCQYVTVNGVTAKVFVPSYEQLNYEWDWPKTAAANRICQYGGSNAAWWTSSLSYSKYVWFVGNGGGFFSSGQSYLRGFRPAIKVKISAIDPPRDPDDWEVVSERLNSLVPEDMLHGILCDTSTYFNAMEKVDAVRQKTDAGMVEAYIAIMACNNDTDLAVKMLTEHSDAFTKKVNEIYAPGMN